MKTSKKSHKYKPKNEPTLEDTRINVYNYIENLLRENKVHIRFKSYKYAANSILEHLRELLTLYEDEDSLNNLQSKIEQDFVQNYKPDINDMMSLLFDINTKIMQAITYIKSKPMHPLTEVATSSPTVEHKEQETFTDIPQQIDQSYIKLPIDKKVKPEIYKATTKKEYEDALREYEESLKTTQYEKLINMYNKPIENIKVYNLDYFKKPNYTISYNTTKI